MNILKVGRKISFDVEKICDDCKTVFTIESVDTREDGDGYYTWCPNCKFVVRVTDDEKSKMLKKYGHSANLKVRTSKK